MRALMQGDIGADEDNITPSPRHHVGYHLGGELIGAQQMHLDLRGKGRGTHLVYPAGIHVPGTGYQQIDLPECVNTFRDEGFHGIGIGDVQRKRDGLTAVGADLLDELGQLIHAAGAQRDRKTPTGQFDCGGRSDARRSPGDDGRSPGRMWLESGHQRPSLNCTVMGRWANPRTLLECTRTEFLSSIS